MQKKFRKRRIEDDDDVKEGGKEDEEERRLAIEEVKYIQKQRERKLGIAAAILNVQPSGVGVGGDKSATPNKHTDKAEADGGGDKEELVLQDTFAQETAVMVEDPNMLKYVELELAKKRGKNVNETTTHQVENESLRTDDELYIIPEHLKVKRRNSEESSTQWTTGIAEVQLPIEYKLRNIEETEAAKKQLQEKRLVVGGVSSRTTTKIPSSYSADYFQRGRDYADKLRREHPELYKDHTATATATATSTATSTSSDPAAAVVAAGGGRRQAATDELMLQRFRKRERHRVMRR